MGFLFHAYRTGKLADIARNGLLIIDKRSSLGAGKLGDYVNVTGYSMVKTFLECLEHECFEKVLGDLSECSSLERILTAAADSTPRLTDVGTLLTVAAERFIAHLTEHYDVEVLRGHEVETIRCLEDGRFEIVHHDTRKPATPLLITSDTVVMNPGGRQRVEEIDGLCRMLRIPSPGKNVKTYTSDDLLRLSSAKLVDTFAPVLAQAAPRRINRIAIIGGAHSAFTMAERLATDLGDIKLHEIAIIHRSPIRLYFETAEEARLWGYSVDAAKDVCPITKRVNRASGLRYRAFEVACSILSRGGVSGAKPRVELIDAGSGEAARARAAECVANSCAVIHGAGYGPNIPTLLDHWGAPIPLQVCRGGIEIDPLGRPLSINGEAISGLFSFGLGSGFRPDAQIGNEPAFRGRINGVWIFHHDIGGRILTGVLQALDAMAPLQF